MIAVPLMIRLLRVSPRREKNKIALPGSVSHGAGMSVVILDGGTGQELIKRAGEEPTPLWSATVLRQRPELVEEVHADFIRAGADVITLNNYCATPSRLRQAGQQDDFQTLQQAAITAAHRARDKAGRSVRIAGCLPPLPGSFKPEARFPVSKTLAEYEQIVEAQADKVDLFLCETLPSMEEARLATRVAHQSGLPVWTALTVDEIDGGLLRSYEPVVQAAQACVKEGAEAVLVNCSPPEAISKAVRLLSSANVTFGAYANGFKTVAPMKTSPTVASLEAREDFTPQAYAEFAKEWRDAGATIIGGCCEVGPDHIALLRETLT